MPQGDQRKLLILAGGVSPEYDVSLESAKRIFDHIASSNDCSISASLRIITRGGNWLSEAESINAISKSPPDIVGYEGTSIIRSLADLQQEEENVVVFPIIHGATGEDGTIQGFLEILGLPYIGCGVRSSAICLDKSVFKTIATASGFPQTRYMTLSSQEWQDRTLSLGTIEEKLKFPVIVKPTSLGSSIGVAKASNSTELEEALENAFALDNVCVVEAAVSNLWEFEVGVLGSTTSPRLSAIGKIFNPQNFVNFEDKYGEKGRYTFEVPAMIGSSLKEQIEEFAKKAYVSFGCEGLARVDFLYDFVGEELYLNEINTMPGMTEASHFPVLWQKSGVSLGEMVGELVDSACRRT